MPSLFASTLGQILLINACASLLTFFLFVAMLFFPANPPWPWQPTYRITSVVRVLQHIPEEQRATVAASQDQAGISFRLTAAPVPCTLTSGATVELSKAFAADLPDGPTPSVHGCDASDPDRNIQLLAPIGHYWLEVRMDATGLHPPGFKLPIIAALTFLCAGVIGMSAWALARVIRPLARLADKADAFGRDMDVITISEQGPDEIRRVARAFNIMQERIALTLRNRTRMLAAISHDLRTPLTRMRLQLDTNHSDTMRDKLRKDLDLMQSMVVSALGFLRTGAEQEHKEWLDLGALIATLCDEYEEGGAAISYHGPPQIRCFCRPDAIQRVFSNLIDNALRFGHTVQVMATVGAEHIVVAVCDDGPGIPAARRADVLEPFVMLDPARGGRSGNVGLGLAIVRDIVQSHGGSLALGDRAPHGLQVSVTLPRQ
ncbi:ATP-binding protein [Duganella guangzhouensis]|nr:ATP-binding protein [Duganella guangzhouensis]